MHSNSRYYAVEAEGFSLQGDSDLYFGLVRFQKVCIYVHICSFQYAAVEMAISKAKEVISCKNLLIIL